MDRHTSRIGIILTVLAASLAIGVTACSLAAPSEQAAFDTATTSIDASTTIPAPTTTTTTAAPTTSTTTAAPTTTSTVSDPDTTVHIAALGDTGTGSPEQYAVASLIDAAEEEHEYDALVLLGDMIYEVGDPALIDSVIRQPYAPVLDGPTRLVPALGNHDVKLGRGDEIMEELGAPGRWYAVDIGPARIIVLDSNRPESATQLAWLEQALAEAQDRWLIVALHHPPYSAGRHGSDLPTRSAFGALFARNGVDLVLAGHEHDYQRSVPDDGITYVVSGGGAKLRPTGTDEFTIVSASELHFLDITINAASIDVVAIGITGVLDTFTLTR